jgi:hypothetical protein
MRRIREIEGSKDAAHHGNAAASRRVATASLGCHRPDLQELSDHRQHPPELQGRTRADRGRGSSVNITWIFSDHENIPYPSSKVHYQNILHLITKSFGKMHLANKLIGLSQYSIITHL